jgi:cytochrome P450
VRSEINRHMHSDLIPVGTDVGVFAYNIHHDATYFPAPFDFKPDRWLVDESAPIDNRKTKRGHLSVTQSASTPFGVGEQVVLRKYFAH